MAPSPQETVTQGPIGQPSKPLTGEELVISGLSGIFPSSDSTFDFMENLYNNVDMVSSEHPRWIFNHPEVPKQLGMVNGMGKFDAQFFRVHYKQACTMEPMSRKLLEHAYSAIYDSGINPLKLRGKKVGVFIGATSSESEKVVIYETIQRNGFGITGCNRAMYANRISYWIDGKGPSYSLDLACASSMAGLEHAYTAISEGQCDAAIVGGCNLCMHPNVSLNLRRAGFLCLDGKTKCFDKNGDGYVRADTMGVIFIQKAKDAKRIYAQIYHAVARYSRTPCPDWLPIRDSKEIEEFLQAFYSSIDVSPSQVEYVEANGSAIAEADGSELEAIGKVFGKEKPVKVGSVKSNMGHAEPASGICAVTKVCLAYHKGQIPANLHYEEPQDHLPSVRDGKIEVVQENTPFNREYIALNAFSYSGANIHVLFKGHYKPKDPERYKCSIPRLVPVSGRNDSCVKTILKFLKEHPIDPEQIGLLHSIYESEIVGHMCRGYTIVDTDNEKNTVCVAEHFEYCTGVVPPVWFVYSGMGSQWAGMGADLMRIPIFASAIQKCHKVLEPKGIDIIRLITEPDKKIYDNILHSFVGIAAVQIGLTDILKELGIVPTNIIGHSVGELGCAYADGCFTAEEMILSAYSRGLVSVQTPFIRGSMAAVGLGYKDICDMVPPEIEIACHNSSESSTISGPVDIMKQFVSELTNKGIFAKEVPCSNIAYHSRYIAEAGPGLKKYLSEVITDPKPRSEKWVSTSVPEERWDEPMAKYSSPEYHTNNLLNSVLFEETAKRIPDNALLIEIAPHGLLQAILKRSHSNCMHVPLTRRGHAKPVDFLLQAIGKLYELGLNPKVDALYPKIEFPVSTETPLLSHLVEWEHNEDWPQAKYNTKDSVVTKIRSFVMSIHDDDYKYFKDRLINDALVFPEAALLVLVWETVAMSEDLKMKDVSVVFQNVVFHSEAYIKAEQSFKLAIMIHKGQHAFEVSHMGTVIVTGVVNIVKSTAIKLRPLQEPSTEQLLTMKDIYKMLHLRGHTYKDSFHLIQSSDIECNTGKIRWDGDWVRFIDSLIQFNILSRDHDSVSTVKNIKKLTINVDLHNKALQDMDDTGCLKVEHSRILDTVRCSGVELFGTAFFDKQKVEQEPDVLETRLFVPHSLAGDIDIDTALLINLQIVAENIAKEDIKLTEIVTNSNPIANSINRATENIFNANIEVTTINAKTVELHALEKLSKSDVFVVDNLLGDEKKMANLEAFLSENAFIITFEEKSLRVRSEYEKFTIISAMSIHAKQVLLLKKSEDIENMNVTYLSIVHDSKFSWVPRVENELKKSKRVLLVSEKQQYTGLLGMVKKLNKEYGKPIVSLIMIEDYTAPAFNPKIELYKSQLKKNLVINVVRKNRWGGYYYIPNIKTASAENISLVSAVPGHLDSLSWVEKSPVTSSNVVKVHYNGPTFRDAEKAVGKVEVDNGFGMDFSGINNKGEKVMGIISGGAISDTVEADPDLLWPVPEHWTLEDAATVPMPYLLAYYCLTLKCTLLKGKSVLVTGGAGALGQAVISICLANNCVVYTTVSDIHKKKFLLRLFPQLEADNIGCSLDDSFANMVRGNTKGNRCSIVINCLSEHLREAAMKCTGMSGVFIDVSDNDMINNRYIGMHFITEERHYRAVSLSLLFKPENINDRKALKYMISEGIANGTVRPISRVVYPANEVSRAFRLLASRKQRGRVLLRMRESTNLNLVKVKPRMTFSADHAYVVVCDKNDLGVSLADHLVKKGARKLIIQINSNSIEGYLTSKLTSWKKQDISVRILSENLQTEEGCTKVLEEASRLGPVEAIFIVQNPGETISSTHEFIPSYNEKAQVVANLDLVSRTTCNELRHFVVLTRSSKSVVDEYATSAVEQICQTRTDIGLPALVYHISLLDELNSDLNVSQSSLRPLKWSSILISLETSLKLNYNNVVTYNLKKRSNEDVLQKISKIVGFNNINDLPEDTTVGSLILTDVGIEEIKTVLAEHLQETLTIEKLRNLTIANLKVINSPVDLKKKVDGMQTFFTFVDEDECKATEPMVSMATKLISAVELSNSYNLTEISETDEEFDAKDTYLMLVPGFNGHHRIFKSVCERLKLRAMTFQLTPDLTNESVQQMAAFIMKFIKNRFELKTKFYLLGYSFGVNVVLELASLMEKEGHVGVVYCLDSSPDACRLQLDAYLGNLSEAQLQNAIAEHMYKIVSGKESLELKEDLKKKENWPDKMEACVNRLRGLVNYSNQYKKSVLEAIYRRMKLARDYEPNFKLQSEVILMKGIPHPKMLSLPEDYNLSKYTTKPVKIYNLESDHASTPYDCRVSNVINKYLEPEILEKFLTFNLCENYIADAAKSW